jgi:IclR family transcriptional regulator, pca regulon regulatory protein
MRSLDRDGGRAHSSGGTNEPRRAAGAAATAGLSKRDFVNSLSRGLDVLRSFDGSNVSMTLSEVAVRVGINRAAARRFLLTFVRDGYATTDGKYFRLLPKVLDLGASVTASLDISEIVQPIINELADELQESCFVAIFDHESVIYIARAMASRVVDVRIDVGSRSPAHAVSTGRVLLSGLDDKALKAYFDHVKLRKFTPHTVTSKAKLKAAVDLVRRQGWSIVNQELEIGLQSISVPIRDLEGSIVAALNVCCPSPRVAPRAMETWILKAMMESARRIRLARRVRQ